MIDGFKIHMTGKELQEYTAQRAEWHMKHAAGYEAKVEELQQLARAADAETHLVGKGSRQDAVSQLMSDAKKHERQARYFKFVSAHVMINETFQLSTADLQLLEIAPGHY